MFKMSLSILTSLQERLLELDIEGLNRLFDSLKKDEDGGR